MAEEIFFKNLNGLIDLFINTLNWLKSSGVETSVNGIVLTMGKMYLQQNSPHEVIDNFISRSYEHWNSIKCHDETFLENNSHVLFEGIPSHYILEFNRLLSLKNEKGEFVIPDNPTRKCIWKYLEALIKNCIVYIHQKRCFDKIKNRYTVAYKGPVVLCDGTKISDGISVKENAIVWNVEL